MKLDEQELDEQELKGEILEVQQLTAVREKNIYF